MQAATDMCAALAHAPSYTRQACLIMNRPDKRARHMARMKRCHFEPLVDAQMMRFGTALTQHDLDHWALIDGGRINRNGSAATEYCEVSEDGEDGKDGSVWLFFRVGPFDTYGGYTWSRALVVFPERLFSRWENDGRVFLHDHILGNADANGHILSYPPLHQHHYHVMHGSNIWRQSINVHGDSECASGQEAYCLYKEFPERLGFHLRERIGVWADFNDVRPAHSSSALTSYVFTGLQLLQPRVAPRPIRQSYMMFSPFLGTLFDSMGLTTSSGYVRGQNGAFGTFVVSSSLDTVMWSTGVLPDVDQVVDSYFHTHREMVDDFLFYEASPGELGLLEYPWLDAFVAYLSAPRSEGLIERLRAHLAQRNRYPISGRPRNNLICQYSALQTYSTAHRTTLGPAGGKVNCPFTRPLKGNTRWTGVALLRRQPEATVLPANYSMHAAVRVYHTLRSDADLDFDPRWRQQGNDGRGPPGCDAVTYPERINFGTSCGEELYVPLDLTLLGWYTLCYPSLMAHLLQLVNEKTIRTLSRYLLWHNFPESDAGKTWVPRVTAALLVLRTGLRSRPTTVLGVGVIVLALCSCACACACACACRCILQRLGCCCRRGGGALRRHGGREQYDAIRSWTQAEEDEQEDCPQQSAVL